MPRIIFLVDLDAFYASVEQRENYSLRGKPLIIGADPKGGQGRGVVVACSYEARKRGVRSGQPISRAYRLCPEANYVTPNLKRYEQVSYDVMELLRTFADKFEQVSIDEAFMDVTQSNLRFGGPLDLAKQIKFELKEREGLTCSIGIAPNKSTAKIASDLHKPDGLTSVDAEHVRDFLAPLPVSKISGIGKKTERILNDLGVKTIGELAAFSPKALYKRFGKPAVWLWAIATAQENVEVQDTYVMKSIGNEYTFEKDTADWAVIDNQLHELIDSVHKRLIEERVMFRTITFKIRFAGFETYTRDKTLRFSTTSKEEIVKSIRELGEEFRGYPKKIRLVGVRVSSLDDIAGRKTGERTLDSFAA
jgi:DNA polymerase IV (DinB-like DNA polymerase)